MKKYEELENYIRNIEDGINVNELQRKHEHELFVKDLSYTIERLEERVFDLETIVESLRHNKF